MENLLLVLIGMFAAACGAIVGLGGGFIIVPFLIMLYVLPAAQIVGTSMAVPLFTAVSSTLAFAKQKRIDYQSGWAFSVAMIPGSVLGAWVTKFMANKTFFVVFGIFMLFMAVFLLFKPNKTVDRFLAPTTKRTFTDASGQIHIYSFHLGFGISVAFFVGFLSSLFGIGGGSVMVPTMVLLLAFPAHIATATSMFSIMLSSVMGTASHAAFGHVLWDKVFWLAAGSLIGGQIGAKAASKLPAKFILRVLSVCLMIVAVRLMFKG